LKIERRLSGRAGRPNKVYKRLPRGIYAFLFFLALVPVFYGCEKGRDTNTGAAANPELLIMLRMEEAEFFLKCEDRRA
jgi:hypothetical protein